MREKHLFQGSVSPDSSKIWYIIFLKTPSRPLLLSPLDTDAKMEGCIWTRESSQEIHLYNGAAEEKAGVHISQWQMRPQQTEGGDRGLCSSKLTSHWSRLLLGRDVPWRRKFPSQVQVPLKDALWWLSASVLGQDLGGLPPHVLNSLHNVTLLPASDLTPLDLLAPFLVPDPRLPTQALCSLGCLS